jgi:hypothetical protein
MTLKRIYKDRPEIKRQVEEKYPYDPKEAKCRYERQKRQYLREQLAKKLYDANHV